MKQKRISIKQLKEKIEIINKSLEDNIYLFKKDNGVDLKIKNQWISTKFANETLTNKQAMDYLEREYKKYLKEK